MGWVPSESSEARLASDCRDSDHVLGNEMPSISQETMADPIFSVGTQNTARRNGGMDALPPCC
jgi:hypothetical protein